MRTQYPSIADAVQHILRDVEAEERVKVAEHQILRQTLSPQIKTAEANELLKLAALCRTIDDDNPEITMGDLHNFMAQVNAR